MKRRRPTSAAPYSAGWSATGGMDTLTAGQVFLGGEEVSADNRRQLTRYRREDVGFVFQFYNLIPNLTALENVEMATELAKAPFSAR